MLEPVVPEFFMTNPIIDEKAKSEFVSHVICDTIFLNIMDL
jgi:hypothetical protein